MFIPGAKGHKTLAATLAAAAAVNPSGDKKIPAPATIAGGRRISAIRPPSARCKPPHNLSCTSTEATINFVVQCKTGRMW